jgi:hypothetical protein
LYILHGRNDLSQKGIWRLQSTPCYARFCLHPGIIRNHAAWVGPDANGFMVPIDPQTHQMMPPDSPVVPSVPEQRVIQDIPQVHIDVHANEKDFGVQDLRSNQEENNSFEEMNSKNIFKQQDENCERQFKEHWEKVERENNRQDARIFLNQEKLVLYSWFLYERKEINKVIKNYGHWDDAFNFDALTIEGSKKTDFDVQGKMLNINMDEFWKDYLNFEDVLKSKIEIYKQNAANGKIELGKFDYSEFVALSNAELKYHSFAEAFLAGTTATDKKRWQDAADAFNEAIYMAYTDKEKLYSTHWLNYCYKNH